MPTRERWGTRVGLVLAVRVPDRRPPLRRRLDHRRLVRVALAGGVALDRTDWHALVWHAAQLGHDFAEPQGVVGDHTVIFAADGEGGSLRIVRQNLDECVLCELCLDAAPDGTVRVKKLYDGTELSR